MEYNIENQFQNNKCIDKLATKKKRRRRKVSSKPSRVELLARPSIRRLQNIWNDSPSTSLSPIHLDKIKSILEEDQFTNPQRTEEYFKQVTRSSRTVDVRTAASQAPPSRSQWLAMFSAQMARTLCTWVAERKNEASAEGDSNSTVVELADVVLARVASILGERKPKRSDPSRLARFMVVVSDRIAVWIDEVIKGNIGGKTVQNKRIQNSCT